MFGRLKSSVAAIVPDVRPSNPKGALDPDQPIRQPVYADVVERNPVICHSAKPGETEWYPPVMIGADAIAHRIVGTRRYVEEASALLSGLEPDSYADYMQSFYRDGLSRF